MTVNLDAHLEVAKTAAEERDAALTELDKQNDAKIEEIRQARTELDGQRGLLHAAYNNARGAILRTYNEAIRAAGGDPDYY